MFVLPGKDVKMFFISVLHMFKKLRNDWISYVEEKSRLKKEPKNPSSDGKYNIWVKKYNE